MRATRPHDPEAGDVTLAGHVTSLGTKPGARAGTEEGWALIELTDSGPGEGVGRFVYDRRYRSRADVVPIDPVNWLPTPNSTYTIVREVSSLAGGRVQIKITKTSTTKPSDKFPVKKIFP